MAKEHGLGNACYISGRDISGDTQTWQLGGQKPMQNTTTLRMLAFDRKGLIPDSSFGYETLLDDDPESAHAYLSTLPYTDELVSVLHRETLGAVNWNMYTKQLNYNSNRGNDGSLLFKTDASSSKGTYWDSGVNLTPGIRTDTAATDGASVDFGAANSFGLQAYLHVFEFTGTDCTIALQSSSDDGAGDAFAAFAGSTFTQVTAGPTHERITTARDGAVERYLRVATSGTFTSIDFAVMVVVNTTEVLV